MSAMQAYRDVIERIRRVSMIKVLTLMFNNQAFSDVLKWLHPFVDVPR